MKYKSALIIFPHQLFEEHPALLQDPDVVVLIEDSLFFGDSQYPAQFHKQKLWFHRASMTRYASVLREREVAVEYVAHNRSEGALPSFISAFAAGGGSRVLLAEPHDFMLERRLDQLCERHQLEQVRTPTPMFLNSPNKNLRVV